MKKMIIFIIGLFFCTIAVADGVALNTAVIGVIVPLKEESQYLQNRLTHSKQVVISGVSYRTGTIHDKKVVMVISGLGKVNSAMIAARLIRDFHPRLIVLSGSSGNINPMIKKGDVVVGKTVINADLGELTPKAMIFEFSQYLKNPQTNTDLPLQFHLNKALADTVMQFSKTHSPKLILGNIATSDAIPNPKAQIELLHQVGIDVVEMEGASLMQACWMFNTNCMVVRGVSNNADESFTQQDIKLAADHAAKVVVDLIDHYKL